MGRGETSPTSCIAVDHDLPFNRWRFLSEHRRSWVRGCSAQSTIAQDTRDADGSRDDCGYYFAQMGEVDTIGVVTLRWGTHLPCDPSS